ncbi:MAG: DUF2007 domain-containing protein [Bacteroidetes bacterium]|nr:MAG: DUF2007 domain-containing protein [Bacteroidota bacterium]
MSQILLTTCNTILEAQMLHDHLANHGIVSKIGQENSPYYNKAGFRLGVQIHIEETDLEAARELLLGKDQITCPHCGSNNIRVSLGPTKLLRAINVFLSLFLAMHIGNKNKMECKECKREFTSFR